MNQNIRTRIFLVGCPRSGTTLLQSLLAANSCIASYPETHFYEKLFSGHLLLAAFGIPSRKARARWNSFLGEVGHPEMNSILPKYAIFVRHFSKAFVEVLDQLTMKQKKPMWLEKTPGHLRCVDQIERLVRDAKFVHIVRNAEDNIASLFEVQQKYPENWGLGYSTIEKCTQRWITDTRISMQCSCKKNHYIVRYEHLIANPRPVIVALCDFIGVPFEEKMLSDYSKVAGQLVLETEQWKASVSEPIRPAGMRKFNEYLKEEQRQYIIGHIPEDLAGYLNYEER
jgi:LPS sulfotransferase NodH